MPRVIRIVGEAVRQWQRNLDKGVRYLACIGFITRWVFERWKGDVRRPDQFAEQVFRNIDPSLESQCREAGT